MRQGKISTRPNARWPGSARPLAMLTIASIMLTALCLSGCATHRKSVAKEVCDSVSRVRESVRTDSVIRLMADSASEYVERRTTPVTVPKSEVMLTIPTDSLRSLPSGASYTDRNGQASVKVSRKAATATEPEYIYVYATCDSLQLQCEQYERTIIRMHSSYGEQLSGLKIRLAEATHRMEELELEEQEKPPNPIGTPFKWFMYGLLGGILIARIKNIISIIKKVTRL